MQVVHPKSHHHRDHRTAKEINRGSPAGLGFRQRRIIHQQADHRGQHQQGHQGDRSDNRVNAEAVNQSHFFTGTLRWPSSVSNGP